MLNSQISDSFSDGNFSHEPHWTGDIGNFIINDSLQLQLYDNQANKSDLFTAFHNTQQTTTWELLCSLNFEPSASNRLSIILMADQPDFKSGFNGYFLRLGSSGSDDAIELRKQQGNTSTLVAAGFSGTIASHPSLRIQIVRDSLANWTISADTSGGFNFVTEGSGTDNTFSQGNFFGFSCQYTLSNAQHFFVDDVKIFPSKPDTVPPKIINVQSKQEKTLELEFDELLLQSDAENLLHYSISPSVTIQNANLHLPSRNKVLLNLAEPLIDKSEYILNIGSVTDLHSNQASPQDWTFTYYKPQAPSYLDLLITELMADYSPAEELPEAEFIEIYNRSQKVINLQDLYFCDPSDTVKLSNFILLPGAYLILCAEEDVNDFKPFGSVIGLPKLPTLNNNEDLLSILDSNRQIIHQVDYKKSWYRDVYKQNGGWTLEMINPNMACRADSSNWIASLDWKGGTPGHQNSIWSPSLLQLMKITPQSHLHLLLSFNNNINEQNVSSSSFTIDNGNLPVLNAQVDPEDYSVVILKLDTPGMKHSISYHLKPANSLTDCLGNAISDTSGMTFTFYHQKSPEPLDVVISEIMSKPSPPVGLPIAQYLEIYNRADKAINLENIFLRDNTANIRLPKYILPPKSQVILTATENQLLLSGYGPSIPITNFPYLSQNGETLTLTDNSGTPLFSIPFESGWHQPNYKGDGGYALELINPHQICLPPSENWTSSTSLLGGTPGKPNAVHANTEDLTPPLPTFAAAFAADSLWVTFSEPLNPSSVNPGQFQITNDSIYFSGFYFTDLSYQHLILSTNNHFFKEEESYTLLANNSILDCAGNRVDSANSYLTFLFQPIDTPQPYDVIFSEIMPNPSLPSGGNAGLPEQEYVELYNSSNKNINLRGLKIGDQSQEVNLPLYILEAGQFVILHNGIDESFQYWGPALAVENLFSLGNTTDYLFLKTGKGNIIDAIHYNQHWYRDNQKATGGWSLELINPLSPCNKSENWRASIDLQGGTPGEINSVWNPHPDKVAPVLIRAFPVSPTLIRLFFNEAIDVQLATFSINYSIESLTINKVEAESSETVLLHLASPLQPERKYTITVNPPFADCVGNSIGEENRTFVQLPRQIAPQSIVINEILFNPETGGADYIEIYNLSDTVINIKDLLFGNLNENNEPGQLIRIQHDYLFFPGTYLAFTPNPIDVGDRYHCQSLTYPHCDYSPYRLLEQALPSLPDKEGTIFIKTIYPQDTGFIDFVRYSEDMHNPLLVDKNGVSLERIDPYHKSSSSENWHSAATTAGYGTPTYQNSQYLGKDSSSLFDPFFITKQIFSPDGDGFEDFLRIQYKLKDPGYLCNIRIFDSRGREVSRLAGNQILDREGFFIWDGLTHNHTIADVGIYLIWIELFNKDGEVLYFKKTCVLAQKQY